MWSTGVAPTLAFATILLLQGQSMAAVQVRELAPFGSISNCAPISLLVVNSGNSSYSITLEAEPAVLAAIITTVAQYGLGLETNASFVTKQPIKATVRVPDKKLMYAETLMNGKADLGINVTDFSDIKGEIITNADGNVMVTGLNGGLVKLSNAGNGDVYLNGSARYMEARHAGTGHVYISGLAGKLVVKNTETGDMTVVPGATGNVTGFLEGTGNVAVPAGAACYLRLRDSGSKGKACAPAKTASPPDTALYWTCGVNVTGAYNCGGGGTEAPGTVTYIPCAVPQSQLVMLGPNFS